MVSFPAILFPKETLKDLKDFDQCSVMILYKYYIPVRVIVRMFTLRK